jgi:class 3 adenylate cyclase/FixJ family two-component response regulator
MTSKKSILCIDDEITILNSLKTELKNIFQKDYQIEVAENGVEAIELVDELVSEGAEVALVISDYLMPEMRGDEVLKIIHQKSPNTIKIMLTGQATVEGVANAIKDARLYRYISKPWQHEDFRLTVTEAVSRYIQNKHLEEKNASLEILNKQQTELIEKLHIKEANLQSALETELKLRETASLFVPNEFLALLGYDNLADIRLGDAIQQEMSVLFCDIRNFTGLSENMKPVESFEFINEYLSYMEPVILNYNGFIDKYIGDAIMALFGGQADDAVNAAIAMLVNLEQYNKLRADANSLPLKIGIGINTGVLILGTVGGEKRMDGTVIGDAVNLSSRTESLTKSYNVPLLITHHTYQALLKPEKFAIRMIDQVTVKGKTELVTVYEVFDADREPVRNAKLETLDLYNQALTAYNSQNISESLKLFSQCLEKNPEDSVSQIYLSRLLQQ